MILRMLISLLSDWLKTADLANMASKPEDEVTDVQHVPWPNENLESSSYTVSMGSSEVADDAEVQLVQEPNVNLEALVGGSNDTKEKDEPNLSQEVQIEELALRQRAEPVNILVIGPTGSGKSTLINNLMGCTVARVGRGTSVTSQVEGYEGEYEGVKIRVFDTVGFGDTKGRSGQSIINEIADANRFDLLLICVRMDCRAYSDVRNMLIMLGKELNKEMWKRSVIVLTFYNMFIQLGSVEDSEDIQKVVQDEIKKYQTLVSGILSGSVNGEVISGIPYCVAGKKLPPMLWSVCLGRCSDNAHITNVGAIVARIGAGIGAACALS